MKILFTALLLFISTCVGNGFIAKKYTFDRINNRIYGYLLNDPYVYSSNSNIDSVSNFLLYGQRPNKKNIDILSFKEKIGFLESRGLYNIKNRFGYLGKYQFSPKTLSGLGFSAYDINTFLSRPRLQEKAMDELILHNINIIDNYGLFDSIGKEVYGVNITLEGMLAGAHLLGPYAVKRFIEKGVVSKDGNGTTIIDYMIKFS